MSEFALSSAHYAVNSNPVQPPSSGPEWYTSSSSGLAGKGTNAPSATGAAMTGAGIMRGGDRGTPAMSTTGMMGMGSYGGDTTNYAFDPAAIGTSGASYGSFEDEPPLLEELGIDIPAILSRTKAILTMRLSGWNVVDLDLGGPFIFMSLLGLAHLLIGKLHFGYILGWTVVASIFAWFVFSRVASPESDADEKRLDVYSCCCILGYSLVPLVIHALGSLMLPRRSPATLLMAVIAVLWSSHTAAMFFVKKYRGLRNQYFIVLYPCFLMYTAFALLTLY